MMQLSTEKNTNVQHTPPQTKSSEYMKHGHEAKWGVLISVGKGRCGASHLPSYFQSFQSGSATEKAITKLKAHLRILTARQGKQSALSPDLRKLSESQKNLGWKGLLEVIWFIQLLKPEPASKSDQVAQGFCLVKF